MTPLAGNLQVRATTVDLPLAKTPSAEEVDAEAKSTDKYVAARAKRYQSMLAAGKALPVSYHLSDPGLAIG